MLKIAICDDEKLFRKEIKEIVMKYMARTGGMYKIDTYESGKDFVALGIDMVKYDILFLDINMDGVDGIQTAKKVRELSKDMFVVFITAYVNYTLEGYKVDAVRYILKNNNNLTESIFESLDAIYEKKNYKVSWKWFDFNEGKRNISLDRLVYIESRLHKLEFHIMEDELKEYTLYETLNSIEKELDNKNFIRVHQSYLVNVQHIKSITKHQAVLSNGMILDIPKARYKDVIERFVSYRGEL